MCKATDKYLILIILNQQLAFSSKLISFSFFHSNRICLNFSLLLKLFNILL